MDKPIPDLLGPAGKVLVLTQMFEEIQRQLFTVEVEQIANATPESDQTLAERRDELKAAEKRLLDQYGDYMPEVEAFLALRAAKENE